MTFPVQKSASLIVYYWLSNPNFAKSSPYFWPQYIQSKLRGRFLKGLWPTQNIWTLKDQFEEKMILFIKFSFYEKATKIWKKISHLFWRYWLKTTVLSQHEGDCFKFFGLLRKAELYSPTRTRYIYRTRSTITRSWLETALEY